MITWRNHDVIGCNRVVRSSQFPFKSNMIRKRRRLWEVFYFTCWLLSKNVYEIWTTIYLYLYVIIDVNHKVPVSKWPRLDVKYQTLSDSDLYTYDIYILYWLSDTLLPLPRGTRFVTRTLVLLFTSLIKMSLLIVECPPLLVSKHGSMTALRSACIKLRLCLL